MKKYHLLQYVENCSPKTRKFKTIKRLKQFVEDFEAKYGRDSRLDNWINYSVTNVTGTISIYDESVSVEVD